MRNIIISGASAVALSTGIAQAGGYESSALSTAFMYEDGGYVEFATGKRDYEVTGSKYAPSGSALKDTSAIAYAFKFDVADQVSLGFSKYTQGSIQLDYSNAGSIIAAGLPVVDLTLDANVLLAKYQFNDKYSAIAGIKQTVVKDATANIFQSVPYAASKIIGGKETGTVIGVAYERPDIALRVELLSEQATDFELTTTNASIPGLPQKTKGSVPDYKTLTFQSGIAADTLVFGSVRKANWATNQLYVAPYAAATSTFKDSTTYSIGIGRKFNDTWSGSITYTTEKKGSKDSTTPLTITNGYQGVTIGAKYTKDNMSVSAGYNYTKLGDIDLTSALGVGNFRNNTVTGFGVKVAYTFD